MTTFAATTFNGETDPGRPQVGTTIEKDGKTLTIGKVDWKESKEIMKMVMGGIEPDKEGFDEVLFEQHKERPFVFWVVYVSEKLV